MTEQSLSRNDPKPLPKRGTCPSVSPRGSRCRGFDGHIDGVALGRHYAYPVDTHTLVEIEEWRDG